MTISVTRKMSIKIFIKVLIQFVKEKQMCACFQGLFDIQYLPAVHYYYDPFKLIRWLIYEVKEE